MQQQVNRFVAKPSCSTEESPFPTQLYPAEKICLLTKKSGGLALPDLNSHFTVMRAKPCQKMFIGSVHPWHQLFRYEVATAGTTEIFGADWIVRNPSLIHFHRILTLPFRDAVEAFSLINMAMATPSPSREDGSPLGTLRTSARQPDISRANRLQVLVSI
jgi:hypothetical protein